MLIFEKTFKVIGCVIAVRRKSKTWKITVTIRHIFSCFISKKGETVAEAHRERCECCVGWKISFWEFSVNSLPHSGRPNTIDSDQLKVMFESDRYLTIREIAETLNSSDKTTGLLLTCNEKEKVFIL